jgi:MoxR-like ATPase
VVLIDEIDKAPRDLPNDVLNEIENMQFEVKETGRSFSARAAYRPIVVLTSNSEKLLPEPFLRRCIFYHLEFPKREQLEQIVERRLGTDAMRASEVRDWVVRAIGYFQTVREQLRRKPATAELLAWLRILEQLSRETGQVDPLSNPALVKDSFPVLAKNKDDLHKLTSNPPEAR